MATCATCGQNFSGFSFGSAPATQCPDCRRQAAVETPPTAAQGAPQFVVAVPTVPTPYVTYTIIALNVAVYLAMCIGRVSWIDPQPLDAFRWGADFGPITLGGQWWRLFTSMFVHFGIIHIGLNMWCLLNLGRSLEFLMGRKAFTASYLACGVASSIVSIWWHPLGVSAGASGAIFGTAGTFAAYVFLKRVALSPRSLKQIRNSLAAFIFYNLAFGAAIGPIDNSAHIGGLIAGAILGAIVPPVPRFRVRGAGSAAADFPVDRSQEDRRANLVAWAIIFGSMAILTGAFLWVRSLHMPDAKYGQAAQLARSGKTDEAVRTLQDLVQNNPNMLQAQMLLGELSLERGDAIPAIASLERAVAIDDSDPQNQQNLALAYLAAGRPGDAYPHVSTALSLEGKADWSTLYIRGICEAKNGDTGAAKRDLQAAATAQPVFKEAADALSTVTQAEQLKIPASQLQFAVPFSALIAKSDEWPLFP